MIDSHIGPDGHPTWFAHWLVAVLVVLASAACAPIPSKDIAVVRTEGLIHPPLLGLDFWSSELHIVELDGKPLFLSEFHNAELAVGRHLITVEVWKGPTGMFGVAPLLGKCRGQIEIEAEAGKTYVVKFRRDENSEVLESIDGTTGAVLLRVPCVPRKSAD
jgi:hypothetical protein